MSSDNYYWIDYRPEVNVTDPWAVTMGFESIEELPEPDERTTWFANHGDALLYADSQYSEYGVSHSTAAINQVRRGSSGSHQVDPQPTTE